MIQSNSPMYDLYFHKADRSIIEGVSLHRLAGNSTHRLRLLPIPQVRKLEVSVPRHALAGDPPKRRTTFL